MRTGWLFIWILLSTNVWGAIDVHEFDSEVQRLRYQGFINEMRCPKCENQNLSGSNSPIAMDLRNELYLMVREGRSDKEIIDFMVERYGEYILYRPRISPVTYMLWFGPLVLLIVGIVVLLVIVRRRRQHTLAENGPGLSHADQERLAQLLQVAERDVLPEEQPSKEPRP